ncbi:MULTISPECIES: helix-turn-helix domain-containing protein [Tenacibaculum]|uniref:helix-turn-helix domain-containing protein n=1 Tax=Tenacibaculum TaxID=104267 RepID=UPI001E2A6BED|nr:helix-turn-helix domain-containing protein [Tenacibaculum finnmarkense]MCD8402080.1 helix-turn-helix domain-containing protein [Tenacibaculum finnmarkense genomovar finnmarkense]MCD8417965.1 helix-turn-helix domain-containing protein [Tenacibaculum finnmarkense genomovar finnmarkense]
MNNPFEKIQSDLIEIKESINKILNPIEDKSVVNYTLSEASVILRVDKQTITNHIKKGNIKAFKMGRRILIRHNELFNSLNEVKSLKYKR